MCAVGVLGVGMNNLGCRQHIAKILKNTTCKKQMDKDSVTMILLLL